MQAFAFLKYGLLLAAVVAIAFGAYDALIVGDLAAGQWELLYGMLSAACFWWLDWRDRRR